jgi:hypothetical protein
MPKVGYEHSFVRFTPDASKSIEIEFDVSLLVDVLRTDRAYSDSILIQVEGDEEVTFSSPKPVAIGPGKINGSSRILIASEYHSREIQNCQALWLEVYRWFDVHEFVFLL